MSNCAVYILTNKKHGTIYIGATRDLARRIDQHHLQATDCFTSKYNLRTLVYYQLCDHFYEALTREKQLKNWRRQWKINLIEEDNPDWLDLGNQLA
ncbi:GIY-YIG nuclease family protein [Thalassotalea nanhaiensis]|uniref:GIY-YIG nuclease family protein n=1 Tax=Thalassotalea nanhaiensis TaxID=3065648 RepID=A0ABY9TNW5_9GAMM|nr:GIY-YIG nuclease family protein [Colwelliaceae bacterium SQ345]